ncbi:MAG: cobalamin biosynthesis protein CobD [Epulopiscium sp.]|nr:cobalamin biosynthesis protein CobD [Candidatus Epulonipiscium sp.]
MKSILIASVVDLLLGDPYSFPHPVKFMGKIISVEEKIGRKVSKTSVGLKSIGFMIVTINILLALLIPYYLLKAIEGLAIIYNLVNIYLIYTCIAARCLEQEATKVVQALEIGLEEGRHRLSYIVGRDTTQLGEEEILKATIETVAENTSDGVIAPLLYIMILGAPGGMVYKMVNTMDSMLGYKNKKYRDLGYFPAKIDDIFNYMPARITGLLMNFSSLFRFNSLEGFKIMIRDRKNHKSPNAAYPEGSVAGLLGVQLGGSNYYYGQLIEKPTIGDATRKVRKEDVKLTIEIMYRSEILMLVGYIIIKSIFF